MFLFNIAEILIVVLIIFVINKNIIRAFRELRDLAKMPSASVGVSTILGAEFLRECGVQTTATPASVAAARPLLPPMRMDKVTEETPAAVPRGAEKMEGLRKHLDKLHEEVNYWKNIANPSSSSPKLSPKPMNSPKRMGGGVPVGLAGVRSLPSLSKRKPVGGLKCAHGHGMQWSRSQAPADAVCELC